MKTKFLNFFVIYLLLIALITMPSIVFAEDAEPLNLDSPSAILVEASSGKVLYEKNSEEKMFPASLTKMLTAIIIIENCDLTSVATVSHNAVMSIEPGYVTANLQIGEELTVEQLLNVLLIGSSNDCANVLAEHFSGSIEDFAILMNDKAKSLGCTNSNFLNPSGAHEENHYSTAKDLAIIARYAMSNSTFRDIVRKTSYKLPATNKYPNDDRYFTNTNSLLIVNNNNRADNYYYPYAIGIKTGFTTPALNCLAAASDKDGLEFITIILGSSQNSAGLSNRYLETIKMFKYGYENYSLKQIATSGDILQTVNVKNATNKTKKLDVAIDKDVFVLVPIDSETSFVSSNISINENLKAPINQGDIIGKVSYDSLGITYEANLIANSTVNKSKALLHIFVIFFILFTFYLVIQYRKRQNKNRRLNKKRH